MTINELTRILSELLSFPLEPLYVPSRPREVREAMCSADKARKLLNYSRKYLFAPDCSR